MRQPNRPSLGTARCDDSIAQPRSLSEVQTDPACSEARIGSAPSRRRLRLLMRLPVRLEAGLAAVGIFAGVASCSQTADALDCCRLTAALTSCIMFILHRVWHPAAAVGSRSKVSFLIKRALRSEPRSTRPHDGVSPICSLDFKWLLRARCNERRLQCSVLMPCSPPGHPPHCWWQAARFSQRSVHGMLRLESGDHNR